MVTSNSSSSDVILSTGIFVGSLLLTQLCTPSASIRRACRRLVFHWLRDEDDDNDNDVFDNPDSFDPSFSFAMGIDEEDAPYVYRQMQGRLSFHEDGDQLYLPASLLPPPPPLSVVSSSSRDDKSSPALVSSGDALQQLRRQQRKQQHQTSVFDSEPTVDAPGESADFYPKNANWSHFDLTELLSREEEQQDENSQTQENETDQEKGDASNDFPKPLVSPPRRQVSLEGDDNRGAEGKDDEDDTTAPATPQFVWTDATVHKKRHHHQTKENGVSGTTNMKGSISCCTMTTITESVPSLHHTEVPVSQSATTPSPEFVATTHTTATAIHKKIPTPQQQPQRRRRPFNRAESLDDRTMFGHHHELMDPEHHPSQLTTAPLVAKVPPRLTRATSASAAVPPRTGPPRPPPSSADRKAAFLARRSISVPDLTHHFELGRAGADANHHDPSQKHSSIQEYDRDLAATVRRQNVKARARYNACIMPDTVVLIRHGQSMGNTNEELYSSIPDNSMPLTKLGWEQARAAGKHLKAMLLQQAQQRQADGGEPHLHPSSNLHPHFIVSPYVRTVETFHGIASAWCDPAEFSHIADRDARLAAWYSRLLELGLTWHEDPRIREQDFGNYQNASLIKQAKRDRHRFGAFYYRFPHGESASDVFDRISTFLDSLWRSFDTNKSRVYVLVTHGIAIRVLLARYFRYTIAQFSMLANPRNCEMVFLQHDGRGRLQLAGRYELELAKTPPSKHKIITTTTDENDDTHKKKKDDATATNNASGEDEEEEETHVVGITFHRRLKVLPPEYIRRVKIRMAYDDE